MWRFHAATMHSEHGSPLVFRPDLRLAGRMEEGPWEAIVAARPDGPECQRGICFRSAVPLVESDLRTLTVFYKSRWPSMQNLIKALLSRGFGRNRTRALERTTSRGVDGAVERLKGRELELRAKVAQLATEPGSAKNLAGVVKTIGQIMKARDDQVAAVENTTLKHARTVGGAERLTKQLHLLTHNALSLALYGSDDKAVRAMEPNTVFALLLDRPATTCIEDGKLTLWVEALDAAAARRSTPLHVPDFWRALDLHLPAVGDGQRPFRPPVLEPPEDPGPLHGSGNLIADRYRLVVICAWKADGSCDRTGPLLIRQLERMTAQLATLGRYSHFTTVPAGSASDV